MAIQMNGQTGVNTMGTRANREWASRPMDERFFTPGEAAEIAAKYRDASTEIVVEPDAIEVDIVDDEIKLIAGDEALDFTHHSFGQIASRAGFRADTLRKMDDALPLVAANLNYGLNRHLAGADRSNDLLLVTDLDGRREVRGVTTVEYQRLWNADLLRWLEDDLRVARGWQVPPARPAREVDPRTRPATEEDCLLVSRKNLGGLAINPGDMIAPAGVYASKHDMFAFMVYERDGGIEVDEKTTLSRFFWIGQSEVGGRAFECGFGLFDGVCGNHLMWGIREQIEIRAAHVGEGFKVQMLEAVNEKLADYEALSLAPSLAAIGEARSWELGGTVEEVVDSLNGLRRHVGVVSQRLVGEAFAAAEKSPRYGAPGSAWGIINGLTEVSQLQPFGEARVEIDRVAGKILDVAAQRAA